MTESVSQVSPAAARRDQIIEVARAHLERFGYRRMVIADLAREVGIAKGSFYLHFTGKEELVVAVIERLREEAQRWADARLAGATSPTQRIRTMLELSFEIARMQPLYRRLQSEDPEFRILRAVADLPGKREEAARFVDGIRATLREGIAAGEFRADLDLETTPFLLGSLVFLSSAAEEIALGVVRPERLEASLVDMFMRAIRDEGPE